MSPLNYGLTPKMKPLAPKRTALVAALDIGTSKIACLIGKLRPQPPQDVLRRRSHAIEVVGFSHTESFGMKAGQVVDLVEASRRCAMRSISPNAAPNAKSNRSSCRCRPGVSPASC